MHTHTKYYQLHKLPLHEKKNRTQKIVKSEKICITVISGQNVETCRYLNINIPTYIHTYLPLYMKRLAATLVTDVIVAAISTMPHPLIRHCRQRYSKRAVRIWRQ